MTTLVEPRTPGLNVIYENLLATSMTNAPPDRIDVPMLWRPFRVLFMVTLLPSLALPLSVLHGIGFARCVWTFKLPVKSSIEKYEQKRTPEFVAYKRVFDKARQKVVDVSVSQDPKDLAEAIAVVGRIRGEYVDNGSGTSYFVLERQTVNPSYLFRREKWAWSVISDLVRHAFPCVMCWFFFPAMRRFNVDMVQWWRGAIPSMQIRHPIPNFFMSVNDYNRAKHRITRRHNLMPVTSKPWTQINAGP
jgi:hypothetical protein